MTLLRLYGTDHSLTTPSRLERLSARRQGIQTRLLELQQKGVIAGALLLSTCNRVEILVEIANEGNGNLANDLLGADLPLRQHADLEVINYLLATATGLNSMVFGEEQILGQLRDAFRTSEELGLLTRKLQMLRSRLLATAREIRRRTGLDQRPPSLASMAVEQVIEQGQRIAILGAGSTGRLVLDILSRRQVKNVLVVNRTLAKAQALARHFGGSAMSLKDFCQQRPALDAMICAVHSDRPLLDKSLAADLKVIVDISQPSVLAADLRGSKQPLAVTLDELSQIAAEKQANYNSIKEAGLIEVNARAETLWGEICNGRPDLGRVVDLHVEGTLSALEEAFDSQLSHLDLPDRERLREVLVKAARRNAHYHIQDLRKLARAR